MRLVRSGLAIIRHAGVQASSTTLPWVWTRRFQNDSRYFRVSEEVREAVHAHRPVVALESTIYTHGLPYPDNLRLAARLESLIRQDGAVPATVGVLDGIARVGLTEGELARIVTKPRPRKISRRDFGLTLKDSAGHGGTTIAGTMILAHLAGIKVFATGGLGGVHRGGQDSFDISADLTELGRTPVAVICSGCKGFLDIGRTLEYLETQGVGVATFADGRTGTIDFPAFWSRESGSKSPAILHNEAEAARVINAQASLSVHSGLLFANPVPSEFSIPREELNGIIHKALQLADEAGARGSANTPFVLNAIKELSDGRSVVANEALVESNVRRGSRVARELSAIERQQVQGSSSFQPATVSKSTNPTPAGSTKPISYESKTINILVAGSIALDTSCTYRPLDAVATETEVQPQSYTSNPATISQSVGGVGANVVRAAQLAGASTKLCSIVANDHAGTIAIRSLKNSEIHCTGIHVVPSSPIAKTGQYVAVNDAHSKLAVGVADMRLMETPLGDFTDLWEPHLRNLAQMPPAARRWVIVDAKWDTKTLHQWLRVARDLGLATAFEPVSTAKSTRLFDAPNLLPDHLPRIVDLATPNELELKAMHDAARSTGATERLDWWQTIDAFGIPGWGARNELVAASTQALVDEGIPQRSIQLLPFIPTVLTKLGLRGVLLTRILMEDDEALQNGYGAPYVVARSKTGRGGIGGLYMRLFPPDEVLADADIVSVNGAGDTFLGALIARLAADENARIEDMVPYAQRASLLTLRSTQSVSEDIAQLRHVL